MTVLPDPTDEALMLQAATGGPHPLAVLFARHHRKLFTFFVKLGHARSGSEDLVQETFLRMLRFAASFRADGRFMPWMYQIARNVAADAWRQRRPGATGDEAVLDALPAAEQDAPDSAHALRETEQRLQRALLMLSHDKRELVLLSRVHQLNTEELARLFDCSTTAIKVRLHRSLVELRDYFDRTEHPIHLNRRSPNEL